RTAEGREALARAEQLEVSGMGKIYLLFLRGIILWREHKPEQAKEQLQQALARFQPLSRRPLVPGLTLLTKSYLCAVETELRNYSKAKSLFSEVEPYLKAHQETELLNACRGATG